MRTSSGTDSWTIASSDQQRSKSPPSTLQKTPGSKASKQQIPRKSSGTRCKNYSNRLRKTYRRSPRSWMVRTKWITMRIMIQLRILIKMNIDKVRSLLIYRSHSRKIKQVKKLSCMKQLGMNTWNQSPAPCCSSRTINQSMPDCSFLILTTRAACWLVKLNLSKYSLEFLIRSSRRWQRVKILFHTSISDHQRRPK